MTSIFKIGNVTDARKNGCGCERMDGRNRQQDCSLSALFHNLADFSLKPFQMVLN